jgi:hypothetical protein
MSYRTTDLPWGAVGAFFALDILLATALIALLCCPGGRVPARIERWFPLKGRWLWMALVAIVGTLHLLSGVIVWLSVLIHRQ